MSDFEDIIWRAQELNRNLAPLRDFERLYGREFLQVAKEIQETQRFFLEASSSFHSAIKSLQHAFEYFREFDRLSIPVGIIADAHRNFASVLSQQVDLNKIAQASTILGPQWHEKIAAYQRLSEGAAANVALMSHYTSLSELALLAQKRLIRVPWESIGSAIQINPAEFSGINEGFTNLTGAYRSLIQSFEEREYFMAPFPPITSAGPLLEIFTSAKVLNALSRSLPEEDYPEVYRQVEEDLEKEIEDSIDKLLAALNPEFRSIWLGAKEALRSENPERARHVLVSLRELVTHVLHTLAPDNQIQAWTSDPSHYHNQRPTREARVLFICRGINHGPFSKFVILDVRASIEFIKLFQRAHELAISFSDAQLSLLVTRAESFLRFLLHIYRSNQ